MVIGPVAGTAANSNVISLLSETRTALRKTLNNAHFLGMKSKGDDMLLSCWKGKRFIRQTDPKGIDAGEYCFDATVPSVGPEECKRCTDRRCRYGFNLEPLRRKKKLRAKVLAYVFDATLDDELLLAGLSVFRQPLCLKQSGTGSVTYSKPCYAENQGLILEELEDKAIEAYKSLIGVNEDLERAVRQMSPLPARAILAKGKRKRRAEWTFTSSSHPSQS